MRRHRVVAMVSLLALAACGRGDSRAGQPDSLRAAPPARAETADRSAGDRSPDSSTDTSAPTAGTDAGGFELYPAARLAAIAAELAHVRSSGRTIGGHGDFHYVQSRRVVSGGPEIHDAWVDVTLVESGRASLLVGGTVAGGALASPGEHRGGTIRGGTPHVLGAGDLLVVPAGVPHQYQVASGDSIVYLTIKVAARPR